MERPGRSDQGKRKGKGSIIGINQELAIQYKNAHNTEWSTTRTRTQASCSHTRFTRCLRKAFSLVSFNPVPWRPAYQNNEANSTPAPGGHPAQCFLPFTISLFSCDHAGKGLGIRKLRLPLAAAIWKARQLLVYKGEIIKAAVWEGRK